MARLLLCTLALVVALAAGAPGASAAPDPCKPKPNNPNPCGNVPEAPVSLLYPLVGAAVVLAFAGAERARRRPVPGRR